LRSRQFFADIAVEPDGFAGGRDFLVDHDVREGVRAPVIHAHEPVTPPAAVPDLSAHHQIVPFDDIHRAVV